MAIVHGWNGQPYKSSSYLLDTETGNVLRTNHALNPAAVSGGENAEYQSRWSWVRSWETGTGPSGGPATFARYVASDSVSGASSRGVSVYGSTGAASPGTTTYWLFQPVTPGETITASVWLRVSAATNLPPDFYTRIRFHDGAGNWVGDAVNGTFVPVVLNEWKRVSLTLTVPAGAAYITGEHRVTTYDQTVGDTLDVTGLLIEHAGMVGDWFSGDSPMIGDILPSMTWDNPSDRIYEIGLDRGMFYGEDNKGIAWNGLVGVNENPNFESQPLFQDGIKYGNQITKSDFAYSIEAFTFPDEVLEYEGTEIDSSGISVYDQVPRPFGLSYRTLKGDASNPDLGYKIHILYNLIAISDAIERSTINEETSPLTFKWNAVATPVRQGATRPHAHVTIDSTKIDPVKLRNLETILYGSYFNDPTLPDLGTMLELADDGYAIVILDLGNGYWQASGSDEDVFYIGETRFQIDNVTAVYLDADTYNVSSTLA